MMTESKCEPDQFKGRTIFMSTYNDILWGERGNGENHISNFCLNCRLCSKIPARTLARPLKSMMLNFAESGHPVCRAANALERGELRSKEGGKKSIH